MEFNQCIDELSIIEVSLRGRSYTYSNNLPNPTFSKLDGVFISNQWGMQAGTPLIHSLIDIPTVVSDHAHLRLSIKKNIIKRK